MDRTLVDTNVLAAYYNNNDSLHEKAHKALGEAARPLVIHEYVAVETINVLSRKLSKAAADMFAEEFLTNADFELLYTLDSGFLLAVNEFTKVKSKQLSFVDTALLSLSQGYAVLTFDDALNRAIKKKAEAFGAK